MQVTQKLIQTGYLFENEDTSVLPLRISRNIGPNEAVDLLPTLKKIYQLILNGKSEKAAELLSEMSGLLVAADLGIAREFLIEIDRSQENDATCSEISQKRTKRKYNFPIGNKGIK